MQKIYFWDTHKNVCFLVSLNVGKFAKINRIKNEWDLVEKNVSEKCVLFLVVCVCRKSTMSRKWVWCGERKTCKNKNCATPLTQKSIHIVWKLTQHRNQKYIVFWLRMVVRCIKIEWVCVCTQKCSCVWLVCDHHWPTHACLRIAIASEACPEHARALAKRKSRKY